jgi:hypothetical protein
MSHDPDFESYLQRKKIDGPSFRIAEPEVYSVWKREFEQIHPNSFTVQKLNLINPVRRKYPLKAAAVIKPPEPASPDQQPVSAPKPGKPVMRPRPKIG